MAFVTRSARKFAEAVSCAPVGPGTYTPEHGGSKRGTTHDTAAFRATSREAAVTRTSFAPPPGHYNPTPGTYESPLPKKFVPFKSSSPRFDAASVVVPGPGAYNVPLSDLGCKQRHSARGPRVANDLKRFGSTKRSGEGDRSGAVSRAGEVNDVSPAYYQIDDGAIRKRVVGGRLAQEAKWKPHIEPEIQKQYPEKRRKRRPPRRCAIVPLKKKAQCKEIFVSPGPGHYNTAHAKVALCSNQFGCTSRRFPSCEHHGPGPGSYQVGRQMGQQGIALAKTGRFKFVSESVPGPGHYTSGPTVDMLKWRNVRCIQGELAFGALADRFFGAKGDPAPGPGSYVCEEPMRDTQPSSMFASQCNRERDLVLDTPAVGTYDPQAAAEIVRIPQVKEGFLTTVDRFEEKQSNNIGPGYYDSLRPHDCARLSEVESGFTCAERFGKDEIARNPGPGQYNVEAKWVKKTYNCLFGEVP